MKALVIKDRDRGLKELQRELEEARSHAVAVGVVGDKAQATHDDGPFSNVQIAAVHEFGTETVPRRSFIRETFDGNVQRFQNAARAGAREVLLGRMNTARALERLGLGVVGVIKKRIAAGIAPALSEKTIARKGSSTPLIDSGQLRNSITHEVRRVG